MSREVKKRVITGAVLALALVLALGQKSGWRLPSWDLSGVRRIAARPQPRPQDTIYGMLDAARTGDVSAYLGAYTGQMADTLKASLAETTAEKFARYLQDSNAAIKGVAINEPQTLTDREVKVRVEYVYQERNEAQWMYLEKTAGGWKIARVDSAERVKTLVPYGTPVQ